MLSNMASPSHSMSADPSQHRQELIERLDIHRTNQSFCDVTVAVKDEEFNAHKVVLAAASPFIRSLLASDMRESKEQLIKIELEEATASVMEAVLQYVYTGNVSVTEESAHNLIATGDYLLLPGLKTMAFNFLKENMTVENCIFNYYFAEKYRCVELGEKAREVINLNFSVILETEDFLSLDMKQVMEWVSSDDITVDAKEEVFKGIVKWVSHNKSERETHFPELFNHVRLMSVSHDFLENELVKEELVIKNTELLDVTTKFMTSATCPVFQPPRKCLYSHMDAIFVCGGNKSLYYFPNQDTWYSLADTLCDHQAQHVVQCQDKIYIVDEEETDERQVMEFYVPSSNSWVISNLREFEENIFRSCAVLQGYLYVASVHGLGVSVLSTTVASDFDVMRYDPGKDYWEKAKGLPSKRICPCLVTNEQHLYMIGGVSGLSTCTLSTTEKFDPKTDEWEEVASTNEERLACFGTAMKSKIYVAGGRQYPNQEVLNTCEVYNPARNECQLMPNLRVPRWLASMVSYEGRLYVLGGRTSVTDHDKARRVLSVEMFDSKRNRWVDKSTIPVKRFETREERAKLNLFNACFVRFYKGVIDELEPLNDMYY
ncbi:kelch-like protein 11 [Oculina patagonica]